MVDPGWAARTPEENDLILKAGSGVASTLAALATYLAEVASIEATATMSTVSMGATNATWQGAANVASTTTQTSINAAAQLLVGWLAEKPPILSTAVSAYTAATSAMIPAAVCVANREAWADFCALNSVFPPFFMPAIVECDREYFGHFWPQNTGTGGTYSATLVSLMPPLALPPTITPPGASPAAPAAAAAAVAQSTATGAAGDAMRASSKAATEAAGGGTDMVSKIGEQALQPLQQALGVLPKAFESVVGLPEKISQPLMSAMQSFGGMMGGADGQRAGGVPGAADALRAGGGAGGGAGTAGLGPTAGAGGGGVGGGGVGSIGSGAGMTSYTRPVSGFAPEEGGRATGLRSAGLLSAAETRVPMTSAGGGGAMPMSPAGMLARQQGENEQESVTRARIAVNGQLPEQR